MSPREAKEYKELVVRLPLDLHAAIKERADREERSIAATIRVALRLYLDRPQNEEGAL